MTETDPATDPQPDGGTEPSTDEATSGSRLSRVANWRVGGFLALLITAAAIPYVRKQFLTFIAAEILIFGIVALGFNVLLGYTGLLSFGHAAFFGGAGYTVGLLLVYTDIQSFLLLAGSALVVVFLLSVVMGYVSVRHTGVYYALLMLALAQIIYLAVSKSYGLTGGTDGLRISAPVILGVNYAETIGYNLYLQFILYLIIVATFATVVVLLYKMMNSPFGLTLQTIRENPQRAAAIGIPVKRYRWYASVLSGMVVGIGGLLHAFLIGRVTPGATLHWTLSGEIAFMTILGGPATFFGPVVGAGVFIVLRTIVLDTVPDAWLLVLGTVLYLVVVFFPSGIYGGLRNVVTSMQQQGVKATLRASRTQQTEETSSTAPTQGGEQS